MMLRKTAFYCLLSLMCGIYWFCNGRIAEAQNTGAGAVPHPPPATSPPADTELDRLQKAGMQAYEHAKYAEAEKAWKAGLEQAQQRGDAHWSARFLNGLGYVYAGMGRFDEALKQYQQALSLLGSQDNKPETSRTLKGMGLVYYNLGQMDKAQDYFHRDLDIQKTFNDKRGLASSLNDLGLISYSLAQFDQARDYFEQARALFRSLDDQSGIALCFDSLGTLCYRLGQYEKAQNYLKDALAIQETLDNPQNLSRTLNHLGNLYDLLGQYDKALENQTRALTLRQALGNQRDISFSLNSLGSIQLHLGQFEQALDHFKLALKIREALGDKQLIAASLNNVAAVYGTLGLFDKAQEDLAHVLELQKDLGNKQDIALTLENLGSACLLLGQFDKAIDQYTRSLEIREALGNKREIADSLSDLGSVYANLGQFEKALECQTQALRLREAIGNRQDIAQTLGSLGVTYFRQGELEKARDSLMRSLEIREALGNKRDIALTLGNLGSVYGNLGLLDKALDSYQRAFADFETFGHIQNMSDCLNGLGDIYYRQSAFEKARDCFSRALDLKRSLGNEQDLAVSLQGLGGTYMALNRYDQAEQAFAEAIRHNEQVGQQMGDPSQWGAFQKVNVLHLYARYAMLLLRQNRTWDALIVVERGRGQGLAHKAAQNHVDFASLLTKQEAENLRGCEAEFAISGSLLRVASERAGSSKPSERGELARQHALAQERYDKAMHARDLLKEGLYARYPEYRRLCIAPPPTVDQLRTLARQHPDTLFLEWAVLDDTVQVFAMSAKQDLTTLTLPLSRKSLAETIAQWRSAIVHKQIRVERDQAAALYQTLIAPLKQRGLLSPGRYSHLAIVADDPLLDAPFAAMMDEQGHRLIARYAFTRSISLGMLTWPPNSRRPTRSLLCAVDPVGSDKPPSAPQRVSALRAAYGPLIHARMESEKVTALFSDATELAGSQAREGVIKREMSRYAILHFATHAVLVPNEGLRSWLLLASEPLNSLEDGRLEASEIMNLPLSAHLAVLSACETGRGQTSGWEGLLGLVWAFHAAGCPSVVASQWMVDDAASGYLTTAFYQQMMQGRPKDEALRQAILQLRKNPKWDLPFYWAAFEVFGNPAPLPNPLLPSPRH